MNDLEFEPEEVLGLDISSLAKKTDEAPVDVTNIFPKPLGQVRHLSYSGISAWGTCRRSWAAAYLYGIRSKGNKYTEIGSAAHALVERAARERFGLEAKSKRDQAAVTTPIEELLAKIPDPKERSMVLATADRLLDERVGMFAIEHEMYTPFQEGAPPILSFLDFVWQPAPFEVQVDDHKTNRQFEGVDVWERKLQPQIYSWGMRKHYPKMKKVWFGINYLIIGQSIRWETDPGRDTDLEVFLKDTWSDMVAQVGLKYPPVLEDIPATVNQYCSSCPLKSTCSTFRTTLQDGEKSIAALLAKDTILERYDALTSLKKLVEAVLEETKEELKVKAEARGGSIDIDGRSVSVVTNTQRKAAFSDIWPIVRAYPESQDDLDELFTVKVGGLDAVTKKLPVLKSQFESMITRVASEKGPTIKVQDPEGIPKKVREKKDKK